MRSAAEVLAGVRAAVNHAILTSAEGNRRVWCDGNPPVHAELAIRVGAIGTITVTRIGDFLATTYSAFGWVVTVLE